MKINIAFVAFAAGADGDGLGGGFLVAEDEDEGDFLEGELADFGVHLFVAGVEFDAEASGFELGFDFVGVGEVLFADGDEADLDGGEPEGEGPGVVLDEDTEETLDGAEEGAVDHDGLVLFAVFAGVFEVESGRGDSSRTGRWRAATCGRGHRRA